MNCVIGQVQGIRSWW